VNPVGVGLDALLALLLIAALALGARLSRRLKALREGQAAFVKSVGELDAAATRAENGLQALRTATTEAHDQLLTRIETARALSARLDRAAEEAEAACVRAEALARAPRAAPALPRPPAPARLDLVFDEADARAEPSIARAPERAARPPSPPHADAGPLARFVARRAGGRP
jgi:hypothetical protein